MEVKSLYGAMEHTLGKKELTYMSIPLNSIREEEFMKKSECEKSLVNSRPVCHNDFHAPPLIMGRILKLNSLMFLKHNCH